MKRAAAIAALCLASMGVAAADGAAEMKARVARYYAANLEPALLTVRIGTVIVSQCENRYASECGRGQKAAAASAADGSNEGPG